MTPFLLALLIATPSPDTALLEVAQRACTRNPELVAEIFAIERAEGLPPGLIAAAALRESSCRPEIHCGDGGRSCGLLQLHGSHKRKAAKVYREIHGHDPKGDPRRDWRTAATYWARRVKLGRDKAAAQCKGRGGYATRADYLWSSGNLTATWRPKCARRICVEPRGIEPGSEDCAKRLCVKRAARCARKGRYETRHWETLRRFRRKAGDVRASAEGSEGKRRRDERDATRAVHPCPPQHAAVLGKRPCQAGAGPHQRTSRGSTGLFLLRSERVVLDLSSQKQHREAEVMPQTKHRHSPARIDAGRLAASRTAQGKAGCSDASRGDSGDVSGKGAR